MATISSISDRRGNVLVVDDELNICLSVGKVLRRSGYQVEQALCVAAALDQLETAAGFDLIIADLMMPQVGGMELLKIVKERWPKTPVLIITGYASIATAVEAMKYGAVGYLPKPFTPHELEQAVMKTMAGNGSHPHEVEELPPAGPIDVDLPFDSREVARATSSSYVEHLTRSDLPLVASRSSRVPAADYCPLGERSCKRLATKGMCQLSECPIVGAERKKAARYAKVIPMVPDPIDVDLPFSRREVASLTSDAYVDALGRSDMPIIRFRSSEAQAGAAPKVLVVDDEPVVVNSIRKTLTRKAFRVDEAFSGREALSRIAASPYDLVLLDMRLPDADGLELLSDMKKRKPNLRIVIVTGYASIETAVAAIKMGAHDYMAKPFTPDELTSMTHRVLKREVA